MTELSTRHYKGLFPKGLGVIFFANLCVNFCIVTFLSTLVMYLTHRLGFGNGDAVSVFGAFMSLAYGLAVLGGYLGGRFPTRFLLKLSFLFCVLGAFLAAVPHVWSLYAGLSLFITGFSLYNPNISHLTSQLYQQEDLRRVAGFTVWYMGINVGATIAAFVSGYLMALWSPSGAFIVGGCVVAIGLTVLLLRYSQFEFRKNPNQVDSASWIHRSLLLLGLLGLSGLVMLLLKDSEGNNFIIVGLGIVATVYFVRKAWGAEDRSERNRILFLTGLIVVSVGFWILYMTSPSLLAEYIDHSVNRHLFGLDIPSSSFWGFGTFFIISFGMIYTWFWKKLSDHHREMPDIYKFGVALMLIGLAYGVLSWISGHATTVTGYHISGYWIVLSYFLQTCGELLIGPAGFAMIGRYAPKTLEAPMMGFWQLGIGIGASLSGLYGEAMAVPTQVDLHRSSVLYSAGFWHLSALALGLGVLVVVIGGVFGRKLKRALYSSK